MRIQATRKFEKAYARLGARQQSQIDNALVSFETDRSDPSLRDHPFGGKMKRLRAFSAAHDLRVIHREEGGFVTIFLLNAGTHNQVY